MDEKTTARTYFNPVIRALGVNVDTNTDAIICPRCRHKIVPEAGQPDVTVPLAYIEYKVHRLKQTSFPFAKITIEQRGWLSDWLRRGHLGYIGLMVIDDEGKRDKFVEMYLIDWRFWMACEWIVYPHQHSFPYDYIKSLALRPDKNIIDLFKHHRLLKIGRKHYLPISHSLIKGVGL